MLVEDIAKEVRNYMNETGMSQHDAGVYIGVSSGTIKNLLLYPERVGKRMKTKLGEWYEERLLSR